MTTTTPDNEPLELGEPDSLAGTFADQIATLKRDLAAAQEELRAIGSHVGGGAFYRDENGGRLPMRDQVGQHIAELNQQLAAAQERAQAAEARAEAYRTNAKLLCAGFEDGKAVYWVHGRPGMFFDALECLDAAIAEGKK